MANVVVTSLKSLMASERHENVSIELCKNTALLNAVRVKLLCLVVFKVVLELVFHRGRDSLRSLSQ